MDHFVPQTTLKSGVMRSYGRNNVHEGKLISLTINNCALPSVLISTSIKSPSVLCSHVISPFTNQRWPPKQICRLLRQRARLTGLISCPV